jgi:hypothetical protein
MPTDKVNQPTLAPTNKVTSGTIFGAIAAIVAWADDKFWHDNIPGPVEIAMIVLAFAVAGYFTKNSVEQAPPNPGIPEVPEGD